MIWVTIPIDIFRAYFYCHPIKLVLEVDGGIHKTIGQREYDIGRIAKLNYWEIEVIRFTDEAIERDINRVIEIINQKSEMFGISIGNTKKFPLVDLGVGNYEPNN